MLVAAREKSPGLIQCEVLQEGVKSLGLTGERSVCGGRCMEGNGHVGESEGD